MKQSTGWRIRQGSTQEPWAFKGKLIGSNASPVLLRSFHSSLPAFFRPHALSPQTHEPTPPRSLCPPPLPRPLRPLRLPQPPLLITHPSSRSPRPSAHPSLSTTGLRPCFSFPRLPLLISMNEKTTLCEGCCVWCHPDPTLVYGISNCVLIEISSLPVTRVRRSSG